MKKAISVLVVFFFFISITSVYATVPDYLESCLVKGKHGVINIFTGWLEVPYQISKSLKAESREDKNDAGAGVLGLLKGLIYGIGRTATGILQLATFILPNHPDNQGVGIPLDSEYAWEDGQAYSFSENGFQPLSQKAARGVIDTVGGILEFPYQLQQASQQDTLKSGLLRICKAVVYPIARIISGAFDLVTLLVPNDVKTYGNAFDERYPCPGLEELAQELAPEESQVDDVYLSQMFSP